jgi:hypothetical protein
MWACYIFSKINDSCSKYGVLTAKEFQNLMDSVHQMEASGLAESGWPFIGSVDDDHIFQYINSVSEEQLIRDIQDLRVVPMFENLFPYSLRILEVDRMYLNLADAASKDPTHHMQDAISLPKLMIEWQSSTSIIRSIYRRILNLRDNTSAAAAELDKPSIDSLKRKMESLQMEHSSVAKVLGLESSPLISASSDTWW